VYFLDNARSHLWGVVHLRQRFVRLSHGKPAYMGPKAGCRLSQEAKRLLAKAENEGTAPFPLPKLAQWRAR